VPTTEGWSLAIAEEPQLPAGASKGQATAAGGILLGSRCGAPTESALRLASVSWE
jgi:hypothetical protein